jgi:D-amino peptidase
MGNGDKLPDNVRIVRGFPRPLEMMQGIDETFAAAVFIGYHASEWTVDAVRGHTISSARLLGVKLNGMEVSEGIFNAPLAGQFGVPVAFVSGNRLAVARRRAQRERHLQGHGRSDEAPAGADELPMTEG